MSSIIRVKDLFDCSRFPSGYTAFQIMYFPFGTLLAVIRLFISFQLLISASLFHDVMWIRRFFLRMMCNVIGIIIREDYSEVRGKACNMLAANHVTMFDHLALQAACGAVSMKGREIPSFLSWALGQQSLRINEHSEQPSNSLPAVNSVHTPLLLQPEGVSTHGRVGLLKFQDKYFNQLKQVTPVAIKIWRPPLVQISTCVIGSPWWAELFWFCFVPCTVFCIIYLPVVKRDFKEDDASFAKKIEEVVAKRLNLESTNYTAADKAELEKKLKVVSPSSSQQSPRRSANLELQRMVAQVMEVLPYVPSDVILKDLYSTRSVDLTIANILEGHISYIAVATSSSQSQSEVKVSATPVPSNSECKPSDNENSSLDTSASTFAKSAHERTLSFNERKNRLLENARRRYVEKHGLKLAGLSTVKFG